MTTARAMPTIALSAPHRRTILTIGVLLVLSGIGWLVCHYGLPRDPDFPEMPNPLEPLWLKVHGAVAMAALVAVGSVMPWHAWRAWQVRRNRSSGLWMIGTMAFLLLTGWALYYVGSEVLRPYLSIVHWVVGLATVPVMWLHIILGRRHRALARLSHS